jgi:hypothetical protein
MRSIFTLVWACLAFVSFSQTTITAKSGTGDWSQANTWESGQVPTNGNLVLIPSTSTVLVKGNVYSSLVTKPNLTIQIDGTLQFEPSGILDLGANSTIQLSTASSKITSQNTSNSQLIIINGVTKYNASVDQTLIGPRFASSSTSSSPTGFSFGVLPIKLTSFTAQAKGSRITLNWSTVEEINSSHFVVEKSTNARSWVPIQTIATQGVGTGYSCFDGTPASGDNFYRLKLVDIDGRFEYSQVLKISGGKAVSAYVSPNPAATEVTVSLSAAPTATVHLQLVANSGQVVREGLFEGASLLRLGLQGVRPGVYTLLLRDGTSLIEASQLLVR